MFINTQWFVWNDKTTCFWKFMLFTGFYLQLPVVVPSGLFYCFTSRTWSAVLLENASQLCRLSFLFLDKCIIVIFWLTCNLYFVYCGPVVWWMWVWCSVFRYLTQCSELLCVNCCVWPWDGYEVMPYWKLLQEKVNGMQGPCVSVWFRGMNDTKVLLM